MALHAPGGGFILRLLFLVWLFLLLNVNAWHHQSQIAWSLEFCGLILGLESLILILRF